MTTDDARRDATISAIVAASTSLLEGINAARSPLSVVSDSLAGLAATLGVEHAMVAIDDAEYGRQVFSSGRAPLGDSGDLLWGPPRVSTDPPHVIDDELARLIVAAVTTSFERARAAAAALVLAPPSAQLVERTDALIAAIAAAADRCARYGWAFTLVLVRLDDGDEHTPRHLGANLRAGDALIDLGTREFGILLAAASSDDVPGILARVGRAGTVSTFCYGLATCPGDTRDAGELLALATARLHDAESTRPAGAIRTLDAPLV